MSEVNEYLDISRIDVDDDIANRAFEILANAKRSRNTITRMEFQRYEPIFRYTGVQEIGQDRFDELTQEWMARFDSFTPIYVVDDNTRALVLTLPPMFNKTNVINTVPNGGDIATGFINACNMEDEFDRKKSMWSSYFQQAISYANDTERRSGVKEASDNMVDELKKQGVVKDFESTGVNSKSNQPQHADEQKHISVGFGDEDVEPL